MSVPFKLGYKPSPPEKVGLGALSGLQLTAGPISDTYIALPDALNQLFEDCVANSGGTLLQHTMAVSAGTPNGPWPEVPSRSAGYVLAFNAAGQPLVLSSTVGSEAWNSRDLKSRPH